MARVDLREITKRFDEVVAVDRLSLDVSDKEFLVLLGPSGCGKTTSLRMIAGLESVDEGEIYIGDTLVNDLEPKDRNVAMVFQNYALYPHMTVYKNMAFPLENLKYSKRDVAKRVREVAELLQIVPLLNRKPTELSGGQQQRVALGRAIVREPQAFLMDEPLSNLDAKLRVYMRAELKKLQKELGVTTVYVTHDQVEAMTMGDRIAIMHDGVLQQLDVPDKIYSRPAKRFVAGFVGSPPFNFFEGSLTKDGALDAGEFKYTLPAHLLEAARQATSDKLVLGIRPQDVSVRRQGKEDGHPFRAELYTTEPLGDVLILDLKIGDTIVKAVVSPDFKAEGHEVLWVGFRPEKVYLFDGETGDSLT